MTLNISDVPSICAQILVLRRNEQHRLQRIAKYMKGDHDSVYVPQGARTEYKWLLKRSTVNYLPLVVSTVSQQLHVDGYRASLPEPGEGSTGSTSTDVTGIGKENAAAWDIFIANRLPARQHGLHRSIMKYGAAYMAVLPGDPQPVMRPVSPRRMTALYADDVDDPWPEYAVEERIHQTTRGQYRVVYLYDDQCRYTLTGAVNSAEVHWPELGDPVIPQGEASIQEHGLGVCPVVRFLHEIDLDGEMDVSGEIEPLIPLQDQINTSTFNGLMAQQYAAFRQRWVAGMVPDDEEGRPREPFRAGVDRLWVAEDGDTKFGEFGQTDLTGFLDSREASIKHMATISQVPPYHLLGQVANLPLALDTPVLTPLGRKMMGGLKRGDEVFAPNGTTVKVKALSPVFHDHECYRVRFDDGTEIVADAQHKWETTHFVDPANPNGDRRHLACPECGWLPGVTDKAPTRTVGVHRRKAHGILPVKRQPGGVRETSVVTTAQIAASVTTYQGRSNHYIPLAKPWDGPEQDFPIDPYVLGVFLGDGEHRKGYITSHKDDVEELAANLRGCGEFLNVRPYISGAKKSSCWTVVVVPDPGRCPYGHKRVASKSGCPECHLIRGRKDGSRCSGGTQLPPRVNMSFPERLRLVGVWGNKHIPERYFQGSFKQRLALLQGLMDTDGTVDRRTGYVAIGQHDERLIKDIHRLVCSVGHKAAFRDRYEYPSTMAACGYGSRRMLSWAALDPVFRLSRKAAIQRTEFTRIGDGQRGLAGSAYGRYIVACEQVDSVPVRCITVDSPEHQFCATDALLACCNSAEALAASRDALDRKVQECQGVLSEPWKQTMQLASLAAGDKDGWDDTGSSITWRDTSARAFAATVDALGKLAQMLGVPATELWRKIPGVSAQEVEQWKAAATSGDALAQLNQMIEAQMTHGAVGVGSPQPGAEPFQGPASGKEPGV